jgi:hypothetical protein
MYTSRIMSIKMFVKSQLDHFIAVLFVFVSFKFKKSNSEKEKTL